MAVGGDRSGELKRGEETHFDEGAEARRVALFRGIQRSIGALIVAFAFVVVLMAASAQQEAMRQLTAIDPLIDYSSAYKIKERMDQLDTSVAQANAAQNTLRIAADKAAADARSAINEFNRAWAPFSVSFPALAAAGCGVSPNAASDVSLDSRQRDVTIVRECLKDGRAGAALTAQVGANLQGATGLNAAYANAFAKGVGSDLAAQRLSQAQADVERLSTAAVNATDRRKQQAFDATDKIRESRWALGGWLIDFPPALLQIILSFVSGAFGALLLILVLVVYPATQFSVVSSGGYGARTMLGGLISLCVFVMLSSGSAVLGSGTTVPASSNYMAFCAIGILAGMFSDRVAAWLSARATSFFSSGQQNGGGAAGTDQAGAGSRAPDATDPDGAKGSTGSPS